MVRSRKYGRLRASVRPPASQALCLSTDCVLCVRAGSWGWDYEQVGVVGSVLTAAPPSDEGRTAWQRFLPGGPLAVLPLGGDRSSIVWSTSQQHAAALVSMPDAAFVEHLNAALSAPTSAFQSSSGASQADAGLYQQSRDALTLDPLAAAVNFGLALAASTAKALGSAGQGAAWQDPPTIVGALGKRASFPLRLSKSSADARHRVVLIG